MLIQGYLQVIFQLATYGK